MLYNSPPGEDTIISNLMVRNLRDERSNNLATVGHKVYE